MDYTLLAQDNSFQSWSRLEPMDTDYTKYGEKDPSVIAAGHKCVDVYNAFANAQQSFMAAGYHNYGDLCSDNEMSRLYTKTHFLLHAIFEYAICLDLSWQAIWAYVQPGSFEYLSKNEYKEMEGDCERDNLIRLLNCAIAQRNVKVERIKDIMLKFDNDEDVKRLRTLYNSLKHRGTIHFVGLGENAKTMMMKVDGKSISRLSREEYTVEAVEKILFDYHKKFQTYFNELIKEIIPADYLNKKVSFVDYVNTMMKIDSIQNKCK